MATRNNLGTSLNSKTDLGGTVNATDDLIFGTGQQDYNAGGNFAVSLATMRFLGGCRVTNRTAAGLITATGMTSVCEVSGAGDQLNLSAGAGTWAKLQMRASATRLSLINGTLTNGEFFDGSFYAGDDLTCTNIYVAGGRVYLIDSALSTTKIQCVGGSTFISRPIGASGLLVAANAYVEAVEGATALTNGGDITLEGGKLVWAGGDITGAMYLRRGILDFSRLKRSITVTGAGESWEGCVVLDPPSSISVTWTAGTTRGQGVRHVPYGQAA